MICKCPDGYVGGNDATCRPVKSLIPLGCTQDSQCESEQACINGVCRNPCQCGPNSNCKIINHKPICSCIDGYEGNPEYNCYPGVCCF